MKKIIMMLCCLVMVGTPVHGMDKAKQALNTLQKLFAKKGPASAQGIPTSAPGVDVPMSLQSSPQGYGVLGNLAGSPYRSPNNGLSRADFRRIKKAREASSGTSMPRVQAIAEWLTELKGTVDEARREASQASTQAHGVDSANNRVDEDGPHVPSSPVRNPVFEDNDNADYESVNKNGGDELPSSVLAEESTGVPVPERHADTITVDSAEEVPVAANESGDDSLLDSGITTDEPAVEEMPAEEQTDVVVTGLLNEMIASLEASESVATATAEKVAPLITEDVQAFVAGGVEELVHGAVQDAEKKNTASVPVATPVVPVLPKQTTQVVSTVPNEVPIAPPLVLKRHEEAVETAEAKKEDLNGVLLRASGIVTIAAAMSCFAYLLVASGLVTSYRELGQVLRSQAVRKSLTSRKKAEVVVALAAPLLLATGGALVIAGA